MHHPDLTIDKEEGHEQGHISFDDKELNNMEFEASVLRLEGNIWIIATLFTSYIIISRFYIYKNLHAMYYLVNLTYSDINCINYKI